jgi:hypothetical protein
MESSVNYISLIISWIFYGLGAGIHFLTDSEVLGEMALTLPENDFYGVVTGYAKDFLTILCFVAAFIASVYTIIEKREHIKKLRKKF